MDSTFFLTTTVSILLALAGYLFTWFNGRRTQQRRDQLERVNAQLSDLYGPLFALVESSDISWRAFRSQYQPNSRYFSDHHPPSEDDLIAWRLWMQTVFMPINLQMSDIIQDHADLLIESDMPQVLMRLQAHVASFKAVMQRWEFGDYAEHESLIHYPSEALIKYATDSYQSLKQEQAELLGLLRG